MALDGTYAGLLASIADWINRADLTAVIPDYIVLAEAQMTRRFLIEGPPRRMVQRSTATISTEFAAVPDDFAGEKAFYLTENGPQELTWCEPEEIIQKKTNTSQQTGNPLFYSVIGDEFQFFPAPQSALAAELTYYRRLATITTGTANWLLTLHPDAYLYGALLQAAPYLGDDVRIPIWESAFATILDDITKAGKVERTGSRLTVPDVAGGTP